MAAVFGRDSNLTLGGGNATSETLRREVVVRRAWATDADFRLAYAVARFTPGTNFFAFCTGLAWHIRGAIGGVVSLLAASIPCSVIVALAMAGYQRLEANPSVAAATRGAVAASSMMLLASVWGLVRPSLVAGARVRAVLVVAGAWVSYDVIGLSALTVLGGAAALGFVSARSERA
jgi:chromate transporter